MKILSFAALLATVAAATATPAFAQDGEVSLTGVRIEARVGIDKVRGGVTLPDPDDDDATISARASDSPIGYGAELGYDQQLGRLVVGAYAGIDTSGAERCVEIAEDDLGCLASGRNLYAGVRAGFVIGNNLLVYAKGGYTRARTSLAYDGDTDSATNITYVIRGPRGGYHVGGGVELAFTPNFYGRVEYAQTRLNGTTWVNPADDDFIVGLRSRRQQVTAGIGLRF